MLASFASNMAAAGTTQLARAKLKTKKPNEFWVS
jgi:hypothetical protein